MKTSSRLPILLLLLLVTLACARIGPAPTWMVCTGLPDGFLYVRYSPRADGPIRGVLPEAAHVVPTGQRSGDWLLLRAPLAGWVDAKFICEEVP